jgi:hypothetical protein
MALKQPFTTDYGITVEYWKIIEINISWIMKTARIRLAGYVSQEARESNKMFLENKYYNITPLNFEANFGVEALDTNNPIIQAYDYIKVNDVFFTNAENV